MQTEDWILSELDKLRARNLTRRRATYPHSGGKFADGSRTVLNFSSNDYLDLTRDERVVAASRGALSELGAGAGASRLMTGSFTLHAHLENAIAEHKAYPSAVLFGSGFLTNAGVIPALVGREDHLFADRLVHASIMDGIVLSRAKHHRFRHNDVDHLEELLSQPVKAGRKLIVTESVFSMDGDVAPLGRIAELARQHGAMFMVDEAHATGVFGPAGAGLVREHELESDVNVAMGTFSKAFGSYGGFVAGSESMCDWLINRARTFMYTTALPAAALAASMEALRIVKQERNLGDQLLSRAAFFRGELQNAGLDIGDSLSQIVPVLIGDTKRTVDLSQRLRERNILALPIRPPTVPAGTARLRLSLTLAHTHDDLSYAAQVVAEQYHRQEIR
ncbi:MAG: 8-amino-7-oxononanoate synthase [Pirellulaceae bacterium]